MFISETVITPRYSETDAMGIIYHANYIIWFELGRTQLIKDLGFDYAALEESGYLSPVLEVNAFYKKPVKYGEKAFMKTWVEEHSIIKTKYGYELWNENGEIAVTGYSVHAVVNKENFHPVSIKKAIPEWHEKFISVQKNQ